MKEFQVGDIAFIAIDNPLYRRVAAASGSWTSHVGVIVDAELGKEIIAESTFPLSKKTPLAEFLARSQAGQYSIKRPINPLSPADKERIQAEAEKRMGILYHTGFNFDSSRQFCSKFIFEVFRDAVGIEIGAIETFYELLQRRSKTPLWFWQLWYFGFVPWGRRTVSPASQYNSPLLVTIEEHLSMEGGF